MARVPGWKPGRPTIRRPRAGEAAVWQARVRPVSHGPSPIMFPPVRAIHCRAVLAWVPRPVPRSSRGRTMMGEPCAAG